MPNYTPAELRAMAALNPRHIERNSPYLTHTPKGTPHMKLRTLLLALPLAATLGLWVGHQVTNADLSIHAPAKAEQIDDYRCITDAECSRLEIFEDGSAVDPLTGETAPEGTYLWDCRTMGNKICGTPQG